MASAHATNPRYTIKENLLQKQPCPSATQLVKDGDGQLNGNLDDRFNALFKANVFSDFDLQKRVPKPVVEKLKEAVNNGRTVDAATADVVAQAMKEWALGRGCTHYSHWFQPLRGCTAEKHDSFIDFFGQTRDLRFEFSGESLLRAEPDGSSFPTGGVRETHQARGYTSWDPSSPPFILEGKNGNTLLIPSMFVSWTGEALDYKTPLIRSIHALSEQALRLLRLCGDTKATSVHSTLGAEQEFFAIDRSFFVSRPDLLHAGRAVFGAAPPRGQELADHYFASMPPRVLAFIQEVEEELWKVGVPTKTRHNEVAPSQYEMAPIFETSNIAADHNLLQMEILQRVAAKHDLAVLLHEKPFKGMNGSGKHNNWSMATNTGVNLLNPTKNPRENITFLAFLAATIKAVDEHADLLRSSVATPGNDYRLGAHEAPPAIMSVYLGELLDEVVQQVMLLDPESTPSRRENLCAPVNTADYMSVGEHISPVKIDRTDRNRTSPFAFTGNKFEFRAAGASQPVAHTNMILNVIVAAAISDMVAEVERVAKEKAQVKGLTEEAATDLALRVVLRETLKKHYRVVFNGNGYSPEWVAEATARGLPHFKDTVEALSHVTEKKNADLFETLKVLSNKELTTRTETFFELYSNTNIIEARTAVDITNTHVVPAGLKYQQSVASSLASVKQLNLGLETEPQEAYLKQINESVNQVITDVKQLEKLLFEEHVTNFESSQERAVFIRDRIVPLMHRVAQGCNALETSVDDAVWPLPKYSEILFLK